MLYPPFAGFPKEALWFLRRLKRNNNRPWFQKHKDEYEENVRFPMQCLIATLGPKLADVAPGFRLPSRRSPSSGSTGTPASATTRRPTRPTSPRTFSARGKKSPAERPGLYLGIELGEIFIGGGLYMPSGEQLKSIRRSIAEHPDEYLGLIEDPAFMKMFGEVMGDKLVKAPLGYPKDHPMIAHLRLKQFFVGKEYGEEECLKPRFADTVAKILTGTMPFVRWLEKALQRLVEE